MPSWLLFSALSGAVAALAGGYWDDAWHTERGRDSFFIAPHMAIYLGVTVIGGALALHVARVARRSGAGAVVADRVLLLAAVAVGVTLSSGPIDNAWHGAFGRDAVLWSPPHMLGIAGTLALGAALLPTAARRGSFHAVVGGLVLAAATFPVAEYETDVPQFSAVWFLPALAVGAAIAFTLVGMTAGPRSWPRARAASAHLGFLLAVSAFLLIGGFDAPRLPLLVVPALALDAVAARWRSPMILSAVLVLVLFAVYVPMRSGAADVFDALVGLPFALVGVWVVLAGAAAPPRVLARRTALLALLVVCLALPAAAMAHDPGQGDPAGTAAVTVSARGEQLAMRGSLRGVDCSTIVGGRLLARRGGRAVTSPLHTLGCAFDGRVSVDEPGRWFIYADVRAGNRTIETWLPVRAGGDDRVASGSRFAYVPSTRKATWFKYGVGGLLYAVMVALLVATFALLRPREPPSAETTTALP